MALPAEADQVVLQGFVIDEDGVPVEGEVVSEPVPLTGQSAAPMVVSTVSHRHIQTLTRRTIPQRGDQDEPGYFALWVLASNDPDLGAYGGRRVTLPGQAPRTIQIRWDAPRVVVTAAMAAQVPGLVVGSQVRAIWYHEAADFTEPPPGRTYYDAEQTDSKIAQLLGSGGAGGVGPAGPAGPKGDKGDKGDPGTPGAKGDTGAAGTAGTAGAKGDKGDTGTAGAAGSKGDTGAKGDKGDKGDTGAKGDPGSGTSGGADAGSLATAAATLFGRYACRDSFAVPVVTVGSSTAYGQGATSDARAMLNRYINSVQADHPLSSGAAQPALSDLAAGLAPGVGIQHIRGGMGGTTAATYLTARMIGQIAALNPAAVVHMVGSNDYSSAVPVATYKANVAAAIDALDVVITVPHVHVLVHAHRRTTVSSPAAPWSAYGTALKELAATKTSVLFVDLSNPFHAVAQDTTDPLRLLGTDKVHLTDQGHAFGADALRAALRETASVVAPFTPLAPDPTAPSDTSVPTAPTALSATPGSAQVALTWTASTDNVAVANYRVYRNGILVGTPTGTSFTDTGLTSGTSYVYSVAAVDTSGNLSPQSTSVSATPTAPADTTAPTTPTNLAAGPATSSTMPLSWTASTDNVAVTGYRIRRGGTVVGTSTTSSFTDTGLSASTSYSYTIAAYDAAGNESSQTAAVTATTAAPPADTNPPSTPTGLAAGTPTNSTVPLSWTASTDNVGVTGYRIRRAGTVIGTTASTSFTDTGLAAGTAYSYTVSAYDAAGNESAQTAAVTATTAAASGPTDVTSGLIFDFDTDTITGLADGATLASWTSQGGSAGALAVAQESVGPTFKANQLGGHPILSFVSATPNRLTYRGSTQTLVPGAAATYAFVLRRTGTISRAIGGASGDHYHALFDTGAANGVQFAVNTVSDTNLGVLTYAVSVLNRWIVLIVVVNGATSKMVVGSEATVSGKLDTTDGVGLSIGGSGTGSGYGNFDLAKYRAYNRVLTDAEIATLRSYLVARYALT